MLTATLILLFVALTLYAVLGGADFGAGVWEFNTMFRASPRERDLLHHAIGPVWETNHVWLIFVLVILFGAFPPAFASLNAALFVPLLLALVGIVFRGSAYAFQSQFRAQQNTTPNRASTAHLWIGVFGLASVMAPFFLGASAGAIASGQLEFTADGRYTGNNLSGWINSLSTFSGFFYVGLCAYCTAAFMCREATLAKQLESATHPESATHLDSEKQLKLTTAVDTSTTRDEDLVLLWRRRALTIGLILGAFAICGLILIRARYPSLWIGLMGRGWWVVMLSFIAGSASLVSIYFRRINLSVMGASLTSAAVVWGWGLAQYPDIIPGVWSAQSAASPPQVLQIILVSTAIGSLFLIPAMWLLFHIFKMPAAES